MNEEMCAGLLSMDYKEFQDIVINYCGRNREVLYWLTHTNVKMGIRQYLKRAGLHEALYVRSVFALIGYQDPLREAVLMIPATYERNINF